MMKIKEKNKVTLEQTKTKTGKYIVKFMVKNKPNNPLLMHNPEGSIGVKTTTGKKQYNPAEEAENAAYRLPSGQLYLKAEAFKGSIIDPKGGATGRKFGKSSAATVIRNGIDFTPDSDILIWHPKIAFLPICPLYNPKNGKKIVDYQIDQRPAVVNKARIIRARPILWEWATDVIITIDTRFISISDFLEIFQNAGIVAGVGDYRPQCVKPGNFGRYIVEIMEIYVIETFS